MVARFQHCKVIAQNKRLFFSRKLFIFASCFLFILFFNHTALSAESETKELLSLDRLLADVQNRVASTKTVQCTFKQERHLSIFSQPIIFTGKMELSRPDKLRWENLAPIPSVLIFAGDKGMRCNDDAPPVHFELAKDLMMKMISEQIWTWVDGDYSKLGNRYAISLTGEREIMLVPQQGEFSDIIMSVKVTFDKLSLQPEAILIQETEGDSTTIRFADYLLNQPVDEDLFSTCYP